MSFEWPYDKISTINSCLAQTHSNLVASSDDGSEEWQAASPAYEIGLAYACESHGWNWLTEWRLLQPSPTAPNDVMYDTAYPLPGDLIHLIMVRRNDVPCDWNFLNGQLIVNARGGPPPPSVPTAAQPVKIKGIFSTNSDPTAASPTVVLALQMFTMSGIYRGLKQDVAEAGRMFAAGKKMLDEAKSRHDMQKPKAAAFNSRMTAVRRGRKPWRQTPSGWSGTGSPN